MQQNEPDPAPDPAPDFAFASKWSRSTIRALTLCALVEKARVIESDGPSLFSERDTSGPRGEDEGLLDGLRDSMVVAYLF